jgi:hypothetical protein
MRWQRYTTETNPYTQIHNGVNSETRSQAGVTILISKLFETKVESYTCYSERMIQKRIKTFRGFPNVIGVHAPVQGREDGSEDFYYLLQKM